MSLLSLVSLLCAATVVIGVPVPQASYYYHATPYYYNPYYHTMYVAQRSQPLRSQGSGGSAFAAGNKIETGTYIKDAESVRHTNARLHGVQAVAEAYPEADEAQNDEDVVQDTEIQADIPEQQDEPFADTPAHDEPAADRPLVTVVQKKPNKVDIQLDDTVDDEDDDNHVSYQARSPGKPSVVYFPISFGETKGGAIAIANAFSNGKGGTAASRATAYGSPTKKRVQ